MCLASLLFFFYLIHSPPCHFSCLAFAVMNLNYAKVTFHCGDLSAALLELAVLPHYHGHAYWQPFPPQKQKGRKKEEKHLMEKLHLL